jgi:hypothetical protein
MFHVSEVDLNSPAPILDLTSVLATTKEAFCVFPDPIVVPLAVVEIFVVFIRKLRWVAIIVLLDRPLRSLGYLGLCN